MTRIRRLIDLFRLWIEPAGRRRPVPAFEITGAEIERELFWGRD